MSVVASHAAVDADVQGTTADDDASQRETREEEAGLQYRDHFSLAYPSSTVRFRSSATSHHVYRGNSSQFVLEETDKSITVKRTRDATGGVMFLRGVYTIVCVLWTGFLFVFCTQLLILLVMNLAVYAGGTTGSEASPRRILGTLLSLPVYVYGLVSALIISFHFVADTWAGQHLLKNLVFSSVDSVLTAWISFGFFLGVPLLAMGICLCANSPDWWSITAILWFSCVSFFYLLFAAAIVYFEIKACLEIVSNEHGTQNDSRTLLKKCVLLRQTRAYSGETTRIYLTHGSLNSQSSSPNPVSEQSIHRRYSLYSRLTTWSALQRVGMFKRLDDPGQRCYPVEEAQDVRPFVTNTTWSLEKLYCKPRHSWFVAVITGPSAITRAQMQSSFACAVVGNLLTWFLVIAFLMWFDTRAWVIALSMLVLLLLSVPTLRSTLKIFTMTKDLVRIKGDCTEEPINEQELCTSENPKANYDTNSFVSSEGGLTAACESSTGVFQVGETYRITQPSDRFCWVMFGAEVLFLFLWPLASLYATDGTAIGSVFVFVGLLSLLRYYLNVGVVLEEVGNMQYLKGKDSLSKWKNQSRTDDIVKNITRSRSRGSWFLILAFIIIVAMAIGIGGVSQENPQEGEGTNMTYMPAFRYEQGENSLSYPTCSLDFNAGGPVATRDFAFLSVLAYETNTSKIQEQLDIWFGTSKRALHEPHVVSSFRNQTKRGLSPVTYKLFSFPNIHSVSSGIQFMTI